MLQCNNYEIIFVIVTEIVQVFIIMNNMVEESDF